MVFQESVEISVPLENVALITQYLVSNGVSSLKVIMEIMVNFMLCGVVFSYNIKLLVNDTIVTFKHSSYLLQVTATIHVLATG